MNVIDKIEKMQCKQDIPDFNIGDTVKVYNKIVEGDNERIQLFSGVVIARKGSGTARLSLSDVSLSASAWKRFSRFIPPESTESKWSAEGMSDAPSSTISETSRQSRQGQ